jgi:DNA-binding GntR family transcriptional regulator
MVALDTPVDAFEAATETTATAAAVAARALATRTNGFPRPALIGSPDGFARLSTQLEMQSSIQEGMRQHERRRYDRAGLSADAPTRSETLADKVFVWLTQEIGTGALRPGQLVSENELAARFGVSRSPVREALRALVRDGTVEMRPRRGYLVSDLRAEDIDGLYRMRELVESEMAALVVEHASDADIERISEITGRLHHADGDAHLLHDCWYELWHLLIDRCPNRTMSEVAETFWRRSIRFRGILIRTPSTQHDALQFADRFLRAAEQRNGNDAREAMATFLQQMREFLLEQVFLTLDGEHIARPVA